jgi:uncharacterized protein YcbX
MCRHPRAGGPSVEYLMPIGDLANVCGPQAEQVGPAGRSTPFGGAMRVCSAKVCSDDISGLDCGDSVSRWLSQVLGRSCRLVREFKSDGQRVCQLPAAPLVVAVPMAEAMATEALARSRNSRAGGGQSRSTGSASDSDSESSDSPSDDVDADGSNADVDHDRAGGVAVGADAERTAPHPTAAGARRARLGFSNESQFLLTSQTSMEKVREHGSGGVDSPKIPVDRFRGNLVVRGGVPFCEDDWVKVMIGGQAFRVLGACQRCQMICIDQQSGERTSEPLLSLARFRRLQGRTFFGQHLAHIPSESTTPFRLSVGDPIVVC